MTRIFQAPGGLRTPTWYESATRWTQLTLVEDDPQSFDIDFWFGVFDQTQSNATCLSAGGYVAYYPSKIALQHVSVKVGDTDPFGDLVAGARARNMHVVARVDPHAVHADVGAAHPEWISVTADGQLRRHWSYPEAYVTCAWGDYNRGFMSEVIREIAHDYDIDAIFANRWAGHGVCYCAHCTTDFKAKTGHDLPRERDPHSLVWQAWLAWSREVLTALVGHWNAVVASERSHGRFIPNIGNSSMLDFALDEVKRYCPILFVDHQGRTGVVPIWSAGRDGKRMRGVMGNKPIGLVTSTSIEEKWRWKDSVQSPEEIRMWMTDGLAHGLRPWFTKFNGKVHDGRWLPPISETFALHAQLEPELAPLEPVAEIALLDPSTTLRSWHSDDRDDAEIHELGLYHAMVEARLPFDLLSDLVLEDEALDRYKLIAVANAAFLSTAQCDALTRYVERGGSLVTSFETSLYDEHGIRRADFGLSQLLGVSLAGEPEAPIKNTYIALDPAGHPLTAGFGGAERIIGGSRRIPVTVTAADASVPFRFIPHFPDLPMEEIYARAPADMPAVVTRELPGGGRVVYLPFNIGEIFWEVLNADHATLIENAVRWALKTQPRVEVEGLGIVDIATRAGGDKLSVHLVNLTNPMMMKGPIREAIALAGQMVSVALPEGFASATARLLVSGGAAEVQIGGGRAEVRLPPFLTNEVVLFEFSR
ncbi:MAG: beta-galactosidase trimerization domain-containing protein [Devosia sp.]